VPLGCPLPEAQLRGLDPWDPAAPSTAPPAEHSDLGAGLMSLASLPQERPSAIIVLSDGRLCSPVGAAQEMEIVSLESP
jgi:hypothetical protein